ncbi:MAG: glycosyltransferase family 39 protein [Candidatus Aminicenantes bacterium]|nr:glycosyltransferase family 39 protein [Candidatus Aminicenantes bacterium]
MFSKKNLVFLSFALFVVLFGIRLIHLSADPPYNLSTSGGPYGDPGGYSFNARNKILFGTWEVDDYNMMYVSFPPHVATYVIFKLLGIGFSQMNLVPVLFSWLCLLFFFFILKGRFNEKYALLGTAALGLNYLFLMYSRIANRIMPSLFFVILGIYFLQKGEKKRGWLLGAGASFIFALLSKSVVFYAVGAILGGYFLFSICNDNIKGIAKRISFIFFGSLFPFLPWFFFIYIPKHNSLESFSRLNFQYLIPPKSLTLILKYFWTRPAIIFNEMPIIAVLGAIFSLAIIYMATQTPKKIPMVDWIFLIWFFVGTLYYATIQQRVTRHFIPHIIPLVFLTICLFHSLLSKPNLQDKKKPSHIFLPFAFLWMLFPTSQLMKFVLNNLVEISFNPISLNLMLLLLSFIFSAVLFLFLRFAVKKQKFILSPVQKKGIVFILILGIFILQGTKYLTWVTHPQFQLKEASQDFGKAFKEAAFAGLWAPVVCLENKHRAYEYFPGYINDCKNFFEKFGITHVFTTTAFNEKRNFEKKFPHVMNRAKLMARYHIWTTNVLLYDVNPTENTGEEGLFEAEIFTQKGGTPRFNCEASQNFAVLSRSRKENFVVLITGEKVYDKGKYEITFSIKREGKYKNNSDRIARLDVISPEIKRALAYKDVFPEDLSKNGYKDFILNIKLRKPLKINFRVFSTGKGSFWIDFVKIKKNRISKNNR